jgi:hypothetical protein
LCQTIDPRNVDCFNVLCITEVIHYEGTRFELDDADVVEVRTDLDRVLDETTKKHFDELEVVYSRWLVLDDAARYVDDEHDVQQTVTCWRRWWRRY